MATNEPDSHVPPVHRVEVADVNQPLADEVARHCLTPEVQPEHIGYLRGENGDGYPAGKTHDDGVRNELDDRPQLERAQHDKDEPRHQRGHYQPGLAILLNDAIDDNDKRAGGAAYLHLAPA